MDVRFEKFDFLGLRLKIPSNNDVIELHAIEGVVSFYGDKTKERCYDFKSRSEDYSDLGSFSKNGLGKRKKKVEIRLDP